MNIRNIGNYEIVLLDLNKKRIQEIVTDKSLVEARAEARELMSAIPEVKSFYIGKIVDNSIWNKWVPNK